MLSSQALAAAAIGAAALRNLSTEWPGPRPKGSRAALALRRDPRTSRVRKDQ